MSHSLRSLRDVHLIVAVFEERSFTAAAAREHATQSGVSQQIRKIEERLGVKLFERSTASVVPTPAGHAYYEACVKVLEAQTHADRVAEDFGHGLDGELVVGLMPTMTRSVLTSVLARFVAEHPNVALRIVEGFSGELTRKVQSGDVAFAIVPAQGRQEGTRSSFFARTPEFLVSAPGLLEPLVNVKLAELRPLKLVVPHASNARRERLEAYFSSVGAAVERRLELDSMFGTLDFVRTSDWMTILPGVMVARDVQEAQLTINPLLTPPLVLDLFVLQSSHHALGKAATEFLRLLEQETERVIAALMDAVEAKNAMSGRQIDPRA
jgi:DNA-binding transcriptional LysR family regulator